MSRRSTEMHLRLLCCNLAFCSLVTAFDSTASVRTSARETDPSVVRTDSKTVKRIAAAVGADGTFNNLEASVSVHRTRHSKRPQSVRLQAEQVKETDPGDTVEYQEGARPATDSWCNPWCFIRLSPVLVLLKMLMTWLIPAAGVASLTSTQKEERDKFWKRVSMLLCFCFLMVATVLVMLSLLSPPTAVLSLAFGWLIFYGLQQPTAEDSGTSVDPDRLYAVDNARWVAMVGIMVTHFYSSIYNGYDDGMVVHEFVVAVFVFSMGLQSAGRGFAITKAIQPLIVYCIADFIWYWLKECGKWGAFDALRPFMMNSTHFFSPLVNYSPGGYLWFLQCFVILKVTHEVLQRLLPDRTLPRLIAAHVLWVIVAFVTKWKYAYLMSLPGQNQALIYHTLLMPTIPMFVMGTVASKDFVHSLQNLRIRCALGSVGLVLLALWAYLPSMEYMKMHWSSPTYVALVGYPMMLLQVLILISLVPHRPTAFSGLGARSLILYILHPFFFELVRNVYQDLLRKPYPWENLTWIDHQYDFIQLMIAWISSILLSFVLGSELIWWSLGLSKRSAK
eukprot:gnl/MRDRNA2_/MRDRNA2_29813_c0_seq2.p1 gnl/MRDRNA2_/MRDRNA2_29813_c0~~gnl/MRDRNA2_/MRDRNA2_29813_c0_seq2.p1  ORF type:complete len:562 (+),score=73.75 gnl/MRDRNA2_/MRDRNA2_29813_c0_seq2:89-1774(+)